MGQVIDTPEYWWPRNDATAHLPIKINMMYCSEVDDLLRTKKDQNNVDVPIDN